MDRDTVMAWVAGYERAWRLGDLEAVGELFTEDAQYLRSPYEPAAVGLEAIRAFWIDDDEDGSQFTLRAEPVAVEGHAAVVRLVICYGVPIRQEYTDLWVLRFAADGRVEQFEEWAYWPDKPFTAPIAPTVPTEA